MLAGEDWGGGALGRPTKLTLPPASRTRSGHGPNTRPGEEAASGRGLWASPLGREMGRAGAWHASRWEVLLSKPHQNERCRRMSGVGALGCQTVASPPAPGLVLCKLGTNVERAEWEKRLPFTPHPAAFKQQSKGSQSDYTFV